mmetsp:Transcript_13976/g.58823  ORF Transcript_13976/g.58823 Transcript_13976/m.58823 type:complete len:554 (-) Transcript_13976:50-1711(-)
MAFVARAPVGRRVVLHGLARGQPRGRAAERVGDGGVARARGGGGRVHARGWPVPRGRACRADAHHGPVDAVVGDVRRRARRKSVERSISAHGRTLGVRVQTDAGSGGAAGVSAGLAADVPGGEPSRRRRYTRVPVRALRRRRVCARRRVWLRVRGRDARVVRFNRHASARRRVQELQRARPGDGRLRGVHARRERHAGGVRKQSRRGVRLRDHRAVHRLARRAKRRRVARLRRHRHRRRVRLLCRDGSGRDAGVSTSAGSIGGFRKTRGKRKRVFFARERRSERPSSRETFVAGDEGDEGDGTPLVVYGTLVGSVTIASAFLVRFVARARRGRRDAPVVVHGDVRRNRGVCAGGAGDDGPRRRARVRHVGKRVVPLGVQRAPGRRLRPRRAHPAARPGADARRRGSDQRRVRRRVARRAGRESARKLGNGANVFGTKNALAFVRLRRRARFRRRMRARLASRSAGAGGGEAEARRAVRRGVRPERRDGQGGGWRGRHGPRGGFGGAARIHRRLRRGRRGVTRGSRRGGGGGRELEGGAREVEVDKVELVGAGG